MVSPALKGLGLFLECAWLWAFAFSPCVFASAGFGPRVCVISISFVVSFVVDLELSLDSELELELELLELISELARLELFLLCSLDPDPPSCVPISLLLIDMWSLLVVPARL